MFHGHCPVCHHHSLALAHPAPPDWLSADELESWEVQGMPTPSVQHLQDVAFAVATGGLAIASALPSIFGQPPSARR